MYRYWQAGEKSKWKIIKDGPDVEQQAIQEGARKLTILALSDVSEGADRQNQRYTGRWYCDIDCVDIEQAIRSARQLVQHLFALQVPIWAIHVYASGKKGFHVEVDETVFSTGRPLKDLPAIYKEMALEMYVLGMDFQVYSGGKGVCWRIKNLQRDDGKFRVPVTIDELSSMTADSYAAYTTTPRIIPALAPTSDNKAHGLEAMMERAKKKVKEKPQDPEPIADEALARFTEEPPPCVGELADYQIKNSRNFNEAALQMGVFIARSGMTDPLATSLLVRMAENGNSNAYPTQQTREEHLHGLVSYLKSSPNKPFSCNAVRSVMANRPCADCTLCKEGEGDLTTGESVGMVAREDGYYRKMEKGELRISTFTFDPVDVFLDTGQSGTDSRRTGVQMNLQCNGLFLGDVTFDEHGWNSKATFKSEIKGIGNLAFYGSEDDIQKIKHITMGEEQDMGEIIQVHRAGVHLHKLGDKRVRVYVEPGLSINQYKVKGTHQLHDKVTAPPNVHGTTLPDDNDQQVTETLRNLMKINSPTAVAQILGWYCACHLKAQIMREYSQFPLLGLWGNAGAGKTMTAGLMAWLNGCNYNHDDAAITVSSITPFALISYCSSSTTVPRILEEYNKSKMLPRVYDQWGEIFKMAFNAQIVARGRLRASNVNGKGGAEVSEIPISAPLVVVSEQAPTMPALSQRMVQVQLDKEERDLDAFFYVQKHREDLRKVAKALVIGSLQTDTGWIMERLDQANEDLPQALTDRPRFSYQTLLVGLDFFQQTVSNLKLDLEGDIQGLRSALLGMMDHKAAAIQKIKTKTEVDLVMADIGIMAQITLNETKTWLVTPTHYLVQDDKLYLDLPVLYATYQAYRSYRRESLIIESDSLFRELVKHEPYYVTDHSVLGAKLLRVTRPVLELDMRLMREKGLDTTLYG